MRGNCWGALRWRGLTLLAHGTRDFLRRDIFHVFAAAVEVDAGLVAIAFGDDLQLEATLLALVHITRGGILLDGVTHSELLCV